MPFLVKQSEATAARRRIPVYLVDATDRYSPEINITSPTIEWSKNGGGQNAGAGSWGEVGDGIYYYECTTGEIDTLGGGHTLRIYKAGCAEFIESIVVVAYDPCSATNLGLSSIDTNIGSRAVESTVAKEATVNTKIPTALSFSGANVNAESKVTAAPTDMALNSTVAKAAGTKGTDNIHDDLDTHNTLLGTKIPSNFSFSSTNVNAESKVTAAPTDMALNSTVAKENTLSAKASQSSVDTVDGIVDTILTETQSHPTLTEIEATAVLAKEASVTAVDADVTFLVRFFTNKKPWNDTTKEWDIYDDAGTTVIAHWKPRVKAGTDVAMGDTAFASTDKVVMV